MELIKSFWIAMSLFTALPVPTQTEWTDSRIQRVPYLMPVVGVIISVLLICLIWLVDIMNTSIMVKGLLITIYFIVVTGGFHLDGLMDSADGFFSRREMKRKLEIMSDSRVGAFAVITLFVFLSLKWMMITESLVNYQDLYPMILIPILSRILQPMVLLSTPFAKEEGLAKMYGNSMDGKKATPLYSMIALLFLLSLYYNNITATVMIVSSMLFYGFYKKSIIKQFGGITGDLLGAFLELNELLLWTLIVIMRGVI